MRRNLPCTHAGSIRAAPGRIRSGRWRGGRRGRSSRRRGRRRKGCGGWCFCHSAASPGGRACLGEGFHPPLLGKVEPGQAWPSLTNSAENATSVRCGVAAHVESHYSWGQLFLPRQCIGESGCTARLRSTISLPACILMVQQACRHQCVPACRADRRRGRDGAIHPAACGAADAQRDDAYC